MTWAPFVLAGLCVPMLVFLGVQQRRATPASRAGRNMGRVASLERKNAARTASRLGVESPGLTIGRTLQGGRWLYQGWESTGLDLGGPRSGKSTCRVIPIILEGPGAVISTSNKRDALDATRDARAARGPVWVFDPMRIADEPASWWWNPLADVTSEQRAAELAGIFAAAITDRDTRSDAFFETKGRRVATALVLAAASAGRTIDVTYRWVVDSRDDEPVGLLRAHGHELLAASLAGEISAPEKQRAGVFGSAERLLAFLTDPDTLRWITPGHGRAEFKPAEFVQGVGTLYALSREGMDSASALVAALTATVANAAEAHAKRSPGGRMPTPMLLALDEVAGIVRWPALPSLYSHFGGRGLILASFVQSFAQLEDAFGRTGAQTMWGAATVKVVGAGIGEARFLDDVSRLVGDMDEPHTTVGQSRGGRSTTRSVRRRRVLDVSDLAALPQGRAVVLSAGAAPTLVRLVPYWDRRA